MPIPTQPGWSLQTSELTACGVRTRVLQGGADLRATEAVVFVHGNPGCCEDWRDLMQAASPLGRVIAFDMPGFGQADKPADYPYSVEGGAAFLGEALRQLGVLRVHLVHIQFTRVRKRFLYRFAGDFIEDNTPVAAWIAANRFL